MKFIVSHHTSSPKSMSLLPRSGLSNKTSPKNLHRSMSMGYQCFLHIINMTTQKECQDLLWTPLDSNTNSKLSWNNLVAAHACIIHDLGWSNLLLICKTLDSISAGYIFTLVCFSILSYSQLLFIFELPSLKNKRRKRQLLLLWYRYFLHH